MDQSLLVRDAARSQKPPLPRTLNIAKISPSNKFGSYEEQLVTLAQAYEAEGSLFLPLFDTTPDKSDVSAFSNRGVDALCLDISTFKFSQFRALRSIVKEHRIDVINWNFTHPRNFYYLALRAVLPGLKHWYTDHNSRYVNTAPRKRKNRISEQLHRQVLAGYSKVIGVSEFVKGELQNLGVWREPHVVKHFINTDRFSPCAKTRQVLRDETGTRDSFVLVTAAHLMPEKGVDVVIRAMDGLPQNVVLWILGDGPRRQDCEQLTEKLGLADRVRFWGLTSDVPRFMRAADAFVCPSVWQEAAGLVNLEAQACGLPVLASRIGGIPEYVSDGKTGLLFAAGDADDLRRQVLKIVEDNQLRRRMSETAMEWAEENFSIRSSLPRFLDVYRI